MINPTTITHADSHQGLLDELHEHRNTINQGVGMVGAGILRAPEKCFKDAFEALKELC